MHKQFKKSLITLIPNDKLSSRKFLLAVSGGMDSIFLLHMFYEMQKMYDFRLGIAHYNYKTTPNSFRSEELCRFYATKFDIPIYIMRISKSIKNNFEGKARVLRYEFFYSLLHKHKYTNIITAHHIDDQIETLFMKRNERDNLVSMLGIRDVNKKVLRPLLEMSKKSICEYVSDNKITYTDDPTNEDNSYLRNRIRNIELKKPNNKKVIKNLLTYHEKSKKLFNLYLTRISNNREVYVSYNVYYTTLEVKREILDFIKVDFIKLFIQSEILRYFNVHITKSNKFWGLLYQFLSTSKSGKSFILSEKIKIYSYKDKIILSLSSKEIILDTKGIDISKKESKWNGTKFIIEDDDLSSLDSKYSISINRSIYERGIKVLPYSECSPKIKKICENNRVYSYMKKKCPIVIDSNDDILWIPGVKSFNERNMKGSLVKLYWDV